MKDFFVSYTEKDKEWAEWVAFELEEAGYTTVIQAWDFRPGSDFILKMDEAIRGTERTIVVLSENFLSATYTQPEWANAFGRDPTGTKRTLIPVRIDSCKPNGLLAIRTYVDLHGTSEEEARARLLGSLKDRDKPTTKPDPFRKLRSAPAFPDDAPELTATLHQLDIEIQTLERVSGPVWIYIKTLRDAFHKPHGHTDDRGILVTSTELHWKPYQDNQTISLCAEWEACEPGSSEATKFHSYHTVTIGRTDNLHISLSIWNNAREIVS